MDKKLLTKLFSSYTILTGDIMEAYYRLMGTIRKLYVQIRDIEKTPQFFQDLDICLYPSEINVIGVIGQNPGINITELAEKIGVTKGAVSQIIKKMVKKSLVIKYNDQNNKKEILLKLTGDGMVVFQEHISIHKIIDPRVRQFYQSHSEEQNKYLLDFLQMVSEICEEWQQKQK